MVRYIGQYIDGMGWGPLRCWTECIKATPPLHWWRPTQPVVGQLRCQGTTRRLFRTVLPSIAARCNNKDLVSNSDTQLCKTAVRTLLAQEDKFHVMLDLRTEHGDLKVRGSARAPDRYGQQAVGRELLAGEIQVHMRTSTDRCDKRFKVDRQIDRCFDRQLDS